MLGEILENKAVKRRAVPRLEKGGGRGMGPHPVDVSVGRQIRGRRMLLGLSQEQLAANLSVTFQQVQKYEQGANRVSASRLYRLAQVLGVSMEFFFEAADAAAQGQTAPQVDTGAPDLPADAFQNDESLKLLRYFYALESDELRHLASEVMKSIAKSYSGEK